MYPHIKRKRLKLPLQINNPRIMLHDFKFRHIGVATPSIEKTSKLYLDAGYSLSETINDPVQNVRIAFLTKMEMPSIELIEPLDNNSPVINIISKSGVTPYHFCYEVNDIEDAIKRLEEIGYNTIAPPVSAVALANKKICFLHHKDGGLIEIVAR